MYLSATFDGIKSVDMFILRRIIKRRSENTAIVVFMIVVMSRDASFSFTGSFTFVTWLSKGDSDYFFNVVFLASLSSSPAQSTTVDAFWLTSLNIMFLTLSTLENCSGQSARRRERAVLCNTIA